MIRDLEIGETTYLVGVVKSLVEKTTKNGSPYVDIEFQDKSGSILAKAWDTKAEDLEKRNIRTGVLAYAKGTVGEFKGQAQFTIDTNNGINIANVADYKDLQNAYPLEDYLPTAPISYEEIKSYLLWAIGQIEDEEIRSLMEEIFEEYGHRLISYPGSLNVHHEYINGLGYHIYRMMGQVFALKEVYREGINWDYLIAGVLIHDLGKVHCYVLSDLGMPEAYSLDNDLKGHLAIGYSMLEAYDISREKKDLLQHLILAHHGKREFGAVATPMTMEAHILHFIDNLDATVTMVEKELDKLDEEEVSGRIWYLDNTKLYKVPEEKDPVL